MAEYVGTDRHGRRLLHAAWAQLVRHPEHARLAADIRAHLEAIARANAEAREAVAGQMSVDDCIAEVSRAG